MCREMQEEASRGKKRQSKTGTCLKRHDTPGRGRHVQEIACICRKRKEDE